MNRRMLLYAKRVLFLSFEDEAIRHKLQHRSYIYRQWPHILLLLSLIVLHRLPGNTLQKGSLFFGYTVYNSLTIGQPIDAFWR
jgi:hypothetical protein